MARHPLHPDARRACCALLLAALALPACEDPARPTNTLGGGALYVDSDPRGAEISVDGNNTGLVTPALVDELSPGAHTVVDTLEIGELTYTAGALVVIDPAELDTVLLPLTISCTRDVCFRDAAEAHAPGNVRFHSNGAGPSFLFDRNDSGITWPAGTLNSYAPLGMPTITALVGDEPVALGLLNVGENRNYWAGRPVPTTVTTEPYTVIVPAWLAPPPGADADPTIRGIEVTQELIVQNELPNVVFVRVTWRNISADSLYRQLDLDAPASGVTYTDVYVGFILDADVGPFTEAEDDLVSYSLERNLVFAYDGDMRVSGYFSGGFADNPGLVGLLLVEGPGANTRLNAWPRVADFAAGVNDIGGRALIIAQQSSPPNHPDPRLGFAPNAETGDYSISVANGPVTLGPDEAVAATFAVLLASPAAGTFTSNVLLPAGDPTDASRPLAAVAARLFALADSVLSPSLPQVDR